MLHTSFRKLEKYHWVLQKNLHLYFCLALFISFYTMACASGNKLTYDSQAYLAAAKSLREGVGLLDQFGSPYIAWPPLYPLILSVGIGSIQPFVFLLHLFCGLGTIYLWDKMAEKVLETPFWRFFFLLVLSISTPFLMIFVFVWSEAVFILLLTIYLFSFQKFIYDRNKKGLMTATVFAFLMLLQRNAGIFILAGSMAGIVLNYSFFHKRELKNLVLHAIFAVSGFALWNFYALLWKGNEHIVAEVVPVYSFLRNGKLVLSEIGKLYVPEPLSFIFGAGIFLSCLLLACYTLYRQKDVWPRLLIVIILTYLIAWVIIPASESDISRFLAVIVPAFHLFIFFLLESLLKKRGRKTYIFFVFIAGIWLIYPLMRAFANALLWHDMDGLSGGLGMVKVLFYNKTALINDLLL